MKNVYRLILSVDNDTIDIGDIYMPIKAKKILLKKFKIQHTGVVYVETKENLICVFNQGEKINLLLSLQKIFFSNFHLFFIFHLIILVKNIKYS